MPRGLPEKNTAHRLFGNSAGYSTNGVVVCVLPQKSKGENAMEYNYYLRQTYRSDGSVWVCIHEAATAEKLGYQDGDKYVQDDCSFFLLLIKICSYVLLPFIVNVIESAKVDNSSLTSLLFVTSNTTKK